MALKPKSDVRSPSGAWNTMYPRLRKINALMGGTDTMRLAGRDFLPQYSRESSRNYEVRLSRTVLFNYFRRTVDSLGGKPFVEPVQLKEYPEEIMALTDDIDLQGNEITVFAQRSFSEAVAKGMTAILVDYPDVEVVTKRDEMDMGARPYFQMISPENILALYTEVENGREIITHARILVQETRVNPDYSESNIEKVIVFEPTVIQTWEQDSKKNWTMTRQTTNSLGEVPLVIYYANREGPMVARPVLQDLADKNIEHWQSSSDQRNILTVARFPILAGKGLTAKELEDVTVSPNQLLGSENADGLFYYVEHSGTAIQAGRTDMEDLKAEMANLAMDLLVKKFSRATATEKSLDAEEASSLLRMMVLSYTDALERAFLLAAKRLGVTVDEDAEIKISTSATGLDNQKDIDALIAGLNSGALKPEDFIRELQRRRVLDPDAVIEPGEMAKAAVLGKTIAQSDGMSPDKTEGGTPSKRQGDGKSSGNSEDDEPSKTLKES